MHERMRKKGGEMYGERESLDIKLSKYASTDEEIERVSLPTLCRNDNDATFASFFSHFSLM